MKPWQLRVSIFLLSQTVSLLGSLLVMYAILWYVTLSTLSSVMMMWMVLTTFIPALIMAPFAGVWADRLNRKWLMIGADTFIALCTLITAVLFLNGFRELWLIFVINALRSLGQAVHQPAVLATYPSLVPKESLIKVQGVFQAIQSGAQVIVPLVAALLLATFPLEWIMLIDVVTAFIAVIMLIFFVQIPQEKKETNESVDYFSDIKKGFQYVVNHSFIYYLILFGFVYMILVAAPSFLTYLQVAEVFGPEPWRLALLETIFGIGMVLGSVLITLGWIPKNRLLGFFVSYLAIGLGTVGLGLPFDFNFYIVVWGFVGFFIATSNPLMVGLIQEKTNPEFIGRVFSLFGLMNTVSLPLGMLVFGPLAELTDKSLVILITGILMMGLSIIPLFNRSLMKQGFLENKKQPN
jgi:DHA3 family macrolide efflux protein-like MFS transporter